MSNTNVKHRIATSNDSTAIRELYLSAFPPEEWESVASLAVQLLDENENPRTLSLVSTQHESIVGHVAFSPAYMGDKEEAQGYILSPLAVDPELQKQQIGSALVRNGLERLAEDGVKIVFVYGDPAYYGRFGFDAELATRYLPSYELQFPFGWHAVELREGARPKDVVRLTFCPALQQESLW